MPHLDAAYNLARWLTGNAADAEDVVQEAYLRAFRYFASWNGTDMRVWLLSIVRNTFLNWVRQNRTGRLVFGEEAMDVPETEPLWSGADRDPEAALASRADGERVNRLVAGLAPQWREVLLLREQEELSYQEIAQIVGVPVGTVMSRLSRARTALRKLWFGHEDRKNDP